jgi:hypothetical protein
VARRFLVIPILLLVGRLAHAEGDPIDSKDCANAQAQLDQAIAQAPTSHDGPSASLKAAREAALRACLGKPAQGAQRSGAPEPAIAVPSMGLGAPPSRPAAPAPSPSPPPALAIPRPSTITTCDPAGCWDSQGSRLNRYSPGVLIGPQGQCSLQGGVVRCP